MTKEFRPADWNQYRMDFATPHVQIEPLDQEIATVAQTDVDRLFTTERGRAGTGLGLAIAQAVAETHGGSPRCETSEEDTCFELVL